MKEKDPLLRGLGQAICALRFERGGISQEGLGLTTDVHRNYIGGIERAERKPTVEKIAVLAAALGVAPSQLLARAEREAELYGAIRPVAEPREGATGTG